VNRESPTSMPLVSICVPLFNHREYIEALLESVNADPYPNKELVVIDDGSTDGSFDVLERWRQRARATYPCVFLRQENAGVSTTLNRLLARATGEYCVIVASDDVLVPGGIGVRQRYLAERPQLAAVFGDARVVDRAGNVLMESGLSQLYHAKKSRYLSSRSLLFEIVVRWSVPGPVLMVRRTPLLAMGGFSPGYLEDFDMYVRLADQEKLGFVDEVVAEYRLHGTNVSRSGDAVVRRMRRALMRTCVKNLAGVRPLTQVYLLIRWSICALHWVVRRSAPRALPERSS
jgi:glycosyltransferase involved in cell wall biosynthesis